MLETAIFVPHGRVPDRSSFAPALAAEQLARRYKNLAKNALVFPLVGMTKLYPAKRSMEKCAAGHLKDAAEDKPLETSSEKAPFYRIMKNGFGQTNRFLTKFVHGFLSGQADIVSKSIPKF